MDVIINTSDNYRIDRVIGSLEKVFDQMGGIGKFVKPGIRVAIKPNLLMAKKPDDACTTHPSIVKAIIMLVQKAGGIASIVESPGGPYNVPLLKRTYAMTGMEAVATETGAQLNFDLRAEKIENPDALLIKSLKVLKPLKDAELIINVAKLKTHGMMVYTGAVKNMFGSIAGLEKADYHLRMSDYNLFANSLIDIFLATKPRLSIIDGIVAMEGDGPSAGVPKYLGVILASEDAFACDYAALQIIGVDYKKVPVLRIAEERGIFNSNNVAVKGTPIDQVAPDEFDVPAAGQIKPSSRFKILRFIGKKFGPRPEIIQEKCKACGTCIEVCPPKAVAKNKDNMIEIDHTKCISCFCCHEFCHEKAIKIRRNIIRNFLEYKRYN